MTGAEFVAQLKAENEVLLRKMDEAPDVSAAADRAAFAGTLAAVVKMALKNEIEAAEIAAEWASTTPEIPAKLALVRHAGEEARHYQLIEAQARKMGIALDNFNPLETSSPVLNYLRTLTTTVERVAARAGGSRSDGQPAERAVFTGFGGGRGSANWPLCTATPSIPMKMCIIWRAANCWRGWPRLPRCRNRRAARHTGCSGDWRPRALRQRCNRRACSVIPGC